VLDAARQLGVDIPSLCYLQQCGPMTSCLVCVVKLQANGRSRVVPACATPVEDGMCVESETDEVRELRRTAFELLLSDHVGDCLSPCHRICPLDLNIPRMIRQIQSGEQTEAMATVRQALALPGVLGRLCHAPCQNGCRRGDCGGSAAIRELERFVADADRGAEERFLPPRKADTNKRVAVVGAGPAGLAAADVLLRQGHRCTIFHRHSQPGGTLRTQVGADTLPAAVLGAEMDYFRLLGAEFQGGMELGGDLTLVNLSQRFDAIVLALGASASATLRDLGLNTTDKGVQVNSATYQTDAPNIFATGSMVKPIKPLVRAMQEGQAAGQCVHQFLVGLPIRTSAKPFSVVMGRVEKFELDSFLQTASPAPRTEPLGGLRLGFTPPEAQGEAARCLHCDCRAAGSCDLQHYAELYGAKPNRFPRERRKFEQFVQPGDVIFEPGKCILCGICVDIAQRATEPLGLTFVGRGFDVQVAAPFGKAFSEGLKKVAEECVNHCPTGAIVFRDGKGSGHGCGH